MSEGRSGGGAWEEYAGLARALDEVRRDEESETARIGTRVEDMRAEADRLEGFLADQGVRLQELAQRLRTKPKLEPIPYQEAPDAPPLKPADALRDIAERINRADDEAERAAERALLPAWLPHWPEMARNLLIYGVVAIGLGLVQYPAIIDSNANSAAAAGGFDSSFIQIAIVLPLVGFLVAWAVAAYANRVRIEGGRTPNAAPRMGFLLLFLTAPVVVVAAVFL